MPEPKDVSNVTVNDSGRWTATLKGRSFETDYGSLEDAVDALLTEEAFACARISAERTRRYRNLMEAAKARGDAIHYAKYRLVVEELEEIALEICKRVKQEAVRTEHD